MAYGEDNFIVRFFKWIWSIISGKEPREKEEEEELKSELREAGFTKEQEHMESEERKLIMGIILRLKNIHKKIGDTGLSSLQIKFGNKSVPIGDVIIALIHTLDNLPKTSIPIKREEAIVSKIISYWAIIEQTLAHNPLGRALDKSLITDLETVRSRLRKLGLKLREEEKITEEKIKSIEEDLASARKAYGAQNEPKIY